MQASSVAASSDQNFRCCVGSDSVDTRRLQHFWHETGGQCKLFGATSGQSCAQRVDAQIDHDSKHDESDRKDYGQQSLDPSMIRLHRSFLSAAFRQRCSVHQGFAIFSHSSKILPRVTVSPGEGPAGRSQQDRSRRRPFDAVDERDFLFTQGSCLRKQEEFAAPPKPGHRLEFARP